MIGRLSACGVCGNTIEYNDALRWLHVSGKQSELSHRPEPDDSAVSGPDPDDLEEIR